MKQFITYSLYLICLPTLVCGQVFTSHLDTNSMVIGDHNKLTIQWTDSSQLDGFEFNQQVWDTIEHLELLEDKAITHRVSNNTHVYKKEFRFTIFDSGQVNLPPIEVSWNQQEQLHQKSTPAYTISVVYPNTDTSGLAPIKPIEKEPLKWQDIDGYVYGILGVMLLIALLFFWIKSIKKQGEDITKTRAIDPHEQAFIKLQALEHKDYLEKENYDAFQVELTFIIREFLGLRYKLNALESTSNELLDKLKNTPFPNSKLPVLRELLTMADLIKFAKAEQPGDFHKRMLFEAKEIVKQTNTIRG